MLSLPELLHNSGVSLISKAGRPPSWLGDVASCSNPDPPKEWCGLCCKAVRANQTGIECEECLTWFHVNCMAMPAQSYKNFANDSGLVWVCNRCTFPNFSTTLLLDDNCAINYLLDFGNGNGFESLGSCYSLNLPDEPNPLGPPLHASSPTTRTNHAMYCNSIKSVNKQAEFLALLDLHQPDVMLGCESKIDPTIPTYSVFSDKYKAFRKDRSNSCGSVFIAINNSITAFEEPHLDVQDCKIVTASIQFSRTKKLYISCFYNLSPTDVCTLKLLDDYLSNLYN